MFGDGPLTLREFAMNEPLPLATIHQAALEFLRHRDDAVLFGAQAVNAYVDEPRMTQEVDILSPRAAELAQQLREHLASRFHIAVRVREIGKGKGYRIFQVRKPRNRHLADVRSISTIPPTRRVAGVLVAAPPELIAQKVIAWQRRRGQPKSGSDWRDIAVLLLAFPELKSERGPVGERLEAAGADEAAMRAWKQIVAQTILPEDVEEGF